MESQLGATAGEASISPGCLCRELPRDFLAKRMGQATGISFSIHLTIGIVALTVQRVLTVGSVVFAYLDHNPLHSTAVGTLFLSHWMPFGGTISRGAGVGDMGPFD